ncbi:solute carrier family 2 member 5 [Homo sapiens]|uniref:Solute carrier family 2, facilitated glucose transporter member 5 n=3 Tax=Homininae TaxID=207598 RepID=A0A140VJK5_HUMAN|eukprot:NP_001129057.1 solute carrier family 2, facilitated glucose transporter member 5 isoform 2 [Homo sapiens]
MEQQDQSMKEGRLTLVLALATLIAAFGSSFQYGYNVAAVNSPALLMQQFYNETYYGRTGEFMEDFPLTLLWSVTVSMFPFGGFIGSLLVGPLVNKFGRKGALLFNNIFSIVPAILMGCSRVATSFELIIISRLLVGICAGVSSNVVPMYLGELAPKNLRGALGVVPQLFITVGILVAQIFGLRNLLANVDGEFRTSREHPHPFTTTLGPLLVFQSHHHRTGLSADWSLLTGWMSLGGPSCPEPT